MKRLRLQENVKIIEKKLFTQGDHVHIGANTQIQAEGGVHIGNNVVISYNCIFCGGDSHDTHYELVDSPPKKKIEIFF